MLRCAIVGIFGFKSLLLLAQEKTETKIINIINNQEVIYNALAYGTQTQLLLYAILEHEGTFFYADSIFLNDGENAFIAKGNVYLSKGDSLQMCSKKMVYLGESLLLTATEEVELLDSKMQLLTDTLLYYNYNTNPYAVYTNGATLTDTTNVLTSLEGKYFPQDKKLFFIKDVVLTNPKCTIYTQNLEYHTIEKIAKLNTPSKIVGQNTISFCDKGDYFSQEKKIILSNNIKHLYQKYKIWADSGKIYQDTEIANYNKNIKIHDTVNNLWMFANNLDLYKKEDSLSIYGRPLVNVCFDQDTLFLHSDTIKGRRIVDSIYKTDNITTFLNKNQPSDTSHYKTDSITTFLNKNQPKYSLESNLIKKSDTSHKLYFYPNVQFFKPNLKGRSKLITYFQGTKKWNLYENPLIWLENYQITGKTIELSIKKDIIKLDSIFVFENTFIISQDLDSGQFNQIKGTNLFGGFDSINHNNLNSIFIKDNGELFYFMRSETQKLVGIYKKKYKDILIKLDSNKMESFELFINTEGALFPDKDVNKNSRKLPDFNWQIDLKPKSKEDIFIWDKAIPDKTIPNKNTKTKPKL